MLQGATVSETPMKNISAVKPKREGGHARAKKARGGQGVLWRRITASFDSDLKKFAANPAMVAPISRWVLFEHLTPTQGMAARRYADIVRKFRKYFSEGGQPSAKSVNLEPVRKPEEDVITRHLHNGTLKDYEEKAARAKKQYHRLMKVLEKYADPISGRNFAKNHLDTLCVSDEEPPAEVREQLATVLGEVAKAFGLDKKPGRVQGYSTHKPKDGSRVAKGVRK